MTQGPSQKSIARPVVVRGAGLHTGRRSTVTLYPAAADFGVRLAAQGGDPEVLDWRLWTPSKKSTAVRLGDGRIVRTIEHMMAALSAFAIDNVLIEVVGDEIPIFDGSARVWCRKLREAGTVAQDAPRRRIVIRKPVQVAHAGGFVRVEPNTGTTLDVTHDVLPAFPVMGWRGPLDTDVFERELSKARSFGNMHKLLNLPLEPKRRPKGHPEVVPNRMAPNLVPSEPRGIWAAMAAKQGPDFARMPLLRGARPWRAAPILGGRILGGARYVDEPGRHVTLDLIGDLTLAGAPLCGTIVAHNPSHERTYALVATLMSDPTAWEMA